MVARSHWSSLIPGWSWIEAPAVNTVATGPTCILALAKSSKQALFFFCCFEFLLKSQYSFTDLIQAFIQCSSLFRGQRFPHRTHFFPDVRDLHADIQFSVTNTSTGYFVVEASGRIIDFREWFFETLWYGHLILLTRNIK